MTNIPIWQRKENFEKRVWLSTIKQNTGSHMLDSGGAYGRHWERNAKLDGSAWDWRYRLNVDQWDWSVTQNVLHYLLENFTILRELNGRFHRFSHSPEMKSASWSECMHEWADRNGWRHEWAWNTYNGESNLSQVVQGHLCIWEGEKYGFIETHNGCDVRGGYSRPIVVDWEDFGNVSEVDARLWCDKHHWYQDCAMQWSEGETGDCYEENKFQRVETPAGWKLLCPICQGELTTD